MSKGKVFIVIISVIIFFIGLGLIAGGGALLWSNSFLRDAEGYYSTKTMDIERDSYAVTTYPAHINFGPDWVFDWSELVKVKLKATDNKGKGVFVGIAEENKLLGYLSGVDRDEITKFDMDYPFGSTEIEYRKFPGSAPNEAPTQQDFWTTSAAGSGEQVLRWGIEEGRYSIAIMNQDGSRGLDISGSIGVKIPMIKGLGIGLLIGGLVVLLFSFALVYVAVSRSRVAEE